MQDPRRDHLINHMGAAVSQLSAADKDLLKAYIEMSYDSTAELERIITAAEPATPVLILETAQPVRSCQIRISCTRLERHIRLARH